MSDARLLDPRPITSPAGAGTASVPVPADQVVPWPPIADVLAVSCLGLSLVVYWLAPSAACAGNRLYTIAIAYEVAMAFAGGVINQWQPQALAGRLSWLCVLILIFPSIVP